MTVIANSNNERIKAKEAALSHDRLKELLNYDPDTGLFTRAAVMSGSSVGSVCGTINPNGYVIVCVDRRLYRAHRLAWFYVYGEWPPHDIDHINHDRSDNRLCNLRCASRSQNLLNSRIRSDNRAGVKNVFWNKQAEKYFVVFQRKNKPIYLSSFTELNAAAECAKKFREREYGEFHCHG